MRIKTSRTVRRAVALCLPRRSFAKEGERHRDEYKFDSSAGMSAFRAKAALLRSAWGNAPGIIDQGDLSAESAYHERHESRPHRSFIIAIQFPEAMPRALVESALPAINPSAVIQPSQPVGRSRLDRRYSSYETAFNTKPAAFSLVEIVLALGVLAFCLIAVVGLMPVGMQINRNASSQTAATNIMATIVSDLRTTPAAATTSPQFALTFGTDKTLYFDAAGQASTSLSSDSRYQLNVRWNSAPTGLYYADLKVTWPASVDPATAAPSGVVAIFAAFDRN